LNVKIGTIGNDSANLLYINNIW